MIAAWCFLQVESRHPEIITNNGNHGDFLDNDKWLSTVSQYEKDKYWNKFRDVSTPSFTAYCSLVPSERGILSRGGCWLLEAGAGREMKLGQPVAACTKAGSEPCGSWTGSPGTAGRPIELGLGVGLAGSVWASVFLWGGTLREVSVPAAEEAG